MITINRIYGILANGAPKSDVCYRYSTASRVALDERHRAYLNQLIPDTLNGESRAASAELLIQFMSSGETWPEFVNEFDPHNTYDQRLDIKPDSKVMIPTMEMLAQWVARNPFLTDKYPLERSNSIIEKLMNTLYSFFYTVH